MAAVTNVGGVVDPELAIAIVAVAPARVPALERVQVERPRKHAATNDAVMSAIKPRVCYPRNRGSITNFINRVETSACDGCDRK